LRPMKLASWTKTPRAGRGAGVGLMFPRQPACQLENLSGMRRLQVAGAGSVRRLGDAQKLLLHFVRPRRDAVVPFWME